MLVNDIHLCDRPPASCTDTYTADLLGLLRQTVQLACADRKLSGVVWAGDVFHLKAPSRTSHRLVQQAIEVGQSYPCSWYIVPGNHDIQHDRLETVHTTQPLGTLFRAGAVQLTGWASDEDGCCQSSLYGVPWQQEWTVERVRAVLAAYREEPGPEPLGGLVVAHAPLYPPGQELKWEHFPAAVWAEAMGGRGFCWYGHVHESHGAPYTVGGVTFANFGALSRGSLHEHNLTREVSVGIWDSGTGQFTRIPLAARPAAEVFRLAEQQEITDMRGRLGDFLAGLGATTLETLTTGTVNEHIRSLDLGSDVEALAAELLEEAQHAR